MDSGQFIDSKTDELIRLLSPKTTCQRFFSKPIPTQKIRRIIEQAYGEGFIDGSRIVAFAKTVER